MKKKIRRTNFQRQIIEFLFWVHIFLIKRQNETKPGGMNGNEYKVVRKNGVEKKGLHKKDEKQKTINIYSTSILLF